MNILGGWFELGEAIAETAAMIDAATHRFLAQLREFDRIGGWHTAGAQSCAHWLSWRVGMDLGAARERVRELIQNLRDAGLQDEEIRRTFEVELLMPMGTVRK